MVPAHWAAPCRGCHRVTGTETPSWSARRADRPRVHLRAARAGDHLAMASTRCLSLVGADCMGSRACGLVPLVGVQDREITTHGQNDLLGGRSRWHREPTPEGNLWLLISLRESVERSWRELRAAGCPGC